MGRLAVFRPHRRLALPFAVAFAPAVWFVARDVSGTVPRLTVGPLLRFVALISVSAVVSYVLAVLIDGAFSFVGWSPRATLPEPDDATIRVFGAFLVAGIGYLALATFVALPWWFDLLVAPLGLVVGLPLVALYGGFVVVTNAVPGLERGLAPFVVVAVGVACSTLWAYLLASLLAEKLDL